MIAWMSWELGLYLLPGLIIGLTIHEFAHAWSASLLGDDFPRRNGRVDTPVSGGILAGKIPHFSCDSSCAFAATASPVAGPRSDVSEVTNARRRLAAEK